MMRKIGVAIGLALGAMGVLPHTAFADASIAQAKAAVASGDVDQALSILELLIEANPKDPDALLLRAQIQLDSRDWGHALESYEQFVKVAPRGAQKRAAEKTIVSLAPVRNSFFDLHVDGGATVYLDSPSLGVFCTAAPDCKRNVLPGDHKLILQQDGYEKSSVPVVFEQSKTVTLKLSLKALPSKLQIKTWPAQAQVLIDGKALASFANGEIAAGRYTVLVSAPDHTSVSMPLVAAAGKPAELMVQLAKPIPLADPVRGATVTVDTIATPIVDGRVPINNDGLSHEVTVQAPGYRSKTSTLVAGLPPGTTINGKLRKDVVAITLRAAPRGTALLVDDKPVTSTSSETIWRGDPGEHIVEVRKPGTKPQQRKLTVEDDMNVNVDYVARRSNRAVWIAIGGTGVFSAAGTVTGLMAFSKERAYRDYAVAANTVRNDPKLTELKNAANARALMSDIAFGGAVIGLGAAAYFYFTNRGPTTSAIRLDVSPTGAGVSGSF